MQSSRPIWLLLRGVHKYQLSHRPQLPHRCPCDCVRSFRDPDGQAPKGLSLRTGGARCPLLRRQIKLDVHYCFTCERCLLLAKHSQVIW